MKTILAEFDVRNYRSCVRTIVRPNAGLSVLIGTNGSGKTNVLNALLFLQKLAVSNDVTRFRKPAAAQCNVRATFITNNKKIFLRSNIIYATDERNNDEIIDTATDWNFREITGVDKWIQVPWQMINREGFGYLEDSRILRTFHSTLYNSVLFYSGDVTDKTWKKINPTLAHVMKFLTGFKYYGASQFTDPSRCPTSIEIEEGRPPRNSLRYSVDHSRFLHDLYASWKHERASFNDFISLVGKQGLCLIDQVNFKEVKTPSRAYEVSVGGKITRKLVPKLLIVPSIRIGRHTLSPNQLSEGTFKALALIFYIHTMKGGLLLIEEPEVCVHHGLLSSIIDLVKDISRERQIVVSTHSDYLLDALQPEHVFLCDNDRNKGTKVQPISKTMAARDFKALKTYLQSSGNLGEFWRHGGIG